MGNDLVDPSDEDIRAAEEMIAERGRRAREWVAKHRPEQIRR